MVPYFTLSQGALLLSPYSITVPYFTPPHHMVPYYFHPTPSHDALLLSPHPITRCLITFTPPHHRVPYYFHPTPSVPYCTPPHHRVPYYFDPTPSVPYCTPPHHRVPYYFHPTRSVPYCTPPHHRVPYYFHPTPSQCLISPHPITGCLISFKPPTTSLFLSSPLHHGALFFSTSPYHRVLFSDPHPTIGCHVTYTPPITGCLIGPPFQGAFFTPPHHRVPYFFHPIRALFLFPITGCLISFLPSLPHLCDPPYQGVYISFTHTFTGV